ncbi:MAG: hypothetical protein AB1679_22390 [Actinomycetota bacterium]
MTQWRRVARLAAVTIIAGCLLPPAVAGAEELESVSTNVNMVGEAFTVRQDGTVPTELLLARYPRAVTEVSDDLSTGFAAFADPGFLLRFGAGAGFEASGKRELTAPGWAECLYPESPKTPTAETRAPGGGLGPTAVAECRPRGSHLAGYATQAAPDGARSGNLRGGPFTATVDTGSTIDGQTDVVAASEINDVTIGGVVTLRSIRNRAVATTTGRAGGAVAKAEATIGALLINGEPVALPSDSIEKLGPALAALAPVVAPAGTFTFDVVPELVETAADGTSARARAAQITVTLRTGQLTTTFGLGYASAGARTIVNEPLGDGTESPLGDGLGELPPSPAESAEAQPATQTTAEASLMEDVVPPSPAGLELSSPAALFLPEPAFTPAPEPAPAPAPTEIAAPAPVLAPAAPATALADGPGGPSKGTVAVLAVITAALLVRYLAHSTKLRSLEAAP